jgi:hypothetical protein
VVAGGLYVLAWVVVIVGAAAYFLRDLPRMRRLRDEVQNESIRELRHDIAELRQRLGKSGTTTGDAEHPGPG